MRAAEAPSIAQALVHLWVTPGHFGEWWGYGTFFLAAASFLTAYTVALPRWTGRPWFPIAGAAGNVAIVGLWAVTRTWGVPGVPHALGRWRPGRRPPYSEGKEGLKAEVGLRALETNDEPERLRLRGSPTFRADGRDLVPLPDGPARALGRRAYRAPDGPKGRPTGEMVRASLRGVAGRR